MDERTKKILTSLKRHEQYVTQYGQRICTLYPVDKVDPSVFEQITVPVSLPVAIQMFGLVASLLAEKAAEKTVSPEVAP